MIRTIFSHVSSRLSSSKIHDESCEKPMSGQDLQTVENIQQNDAADHITNATNELTGTVIFADARDKLFMIKSSDDVDYTARLPKNDWHPIVGDKVQMTAVIKDENSEISLEIIKITPRTKDILCGRITALGEQYAVFDDRYILFYNTLKDVPPLKMFDEHKVEVIESDQKSGISSFGYRVINLIKKIESNIIGNGIIFENKPFKIYLNQDEKKEIGTKHINIFNRSDKPALLISMQIIPFLPENSDLIHFNKTGAKINFLLKPKVGKFKAYFNINIQSNKTGKFFFNLITNFETFSQKHEFSVEILKSYIVPGEKFHKTPRFVDVHISEHAIPSDLKDVDYNKFAAAKEELENLYPSLKESLNPLSYLERMKLSIFLEEIAMERSFANYHIDRGVFEIKGEFLKLKVNDIAEKRPSIIIGDKIVASDLSKSGEEDRPVYEGYIHKVGDEYILCKFHSDVHEEHNVEKEFSIDFIFSRSIFRKQHHALDNFLSNSMLGYNFLFPNNKICSKKIQLDATIDSEGNLLIDKMPQNWHNNHLNKYQKNAIINVLRGETRPLPYIFFGCPGSGKTQTVVETIIQLHKNIRTSKIIIATPSNSAANLIVEMLINSDVFDKDDPKFLRIVSNNQVEKDLIPDFLTKYCATVSIASDNHQNNGKNNKTSPSRNNRGILEKCTKSKIMEYDIIVATLNGIGSLMQMSFESYFTHVIIDEAGQSIEPETIIPLSMMNSKNGQCILSGDPLQLGAIIVSRFSKVFGLNSSLLERLLLSHPYYAQTYGPKKNEYDEKFVTKLKINYRSHPSVLKIYNDMFYNSELENAINDTDSHEALFLSSIDDLIWKNMNKNCGIIFVNVCNGKNKKSPESCSWYNDQEINGIMAFLNKCRSKNIPFKNIGILAPYALQVKKLKGQISFLNDSDLKIGTVEEFQGQERLIMILSTVRTEARHLSADTRFGLGFLQCPKRINVAISRARALMVIFGNQSILEKDSNWKQIIEYAKANNTYVTENY